MLYLTSDTMGGLAFDQDFGILDKHQWSGPVVLLRSGLSVFGTVTPAPWLAHVAFALLPRSSLLWSSLISFAKRLTDDRLSRGARTKDASSWMIEAERQRDQNMNINNLYGDTFAMIIAGRLVFHFSSILET